MGWLKTLFGKKTPPPYVTAIHGHRFAVVRRPLEILEYGGHSGSLARQKFEGVWPNDGETIELWDKDVCRGRK